jgi:hypothetical protein
MGRHVWPQSIHKGEPPKAPLLLRDLLESLKGFEPQEAVNKFNRPVYFNVDGRAEQYEVYRVDGGDVGQPLVVHIGIVF